ncbi:MAG: pectin esterase [Sphingobacteriaceae bacterium]|jgi:pectinesterase|nr:pectin esterase [Sphingobacteriaceae bacterium]
MKNLLLALLLVCSLSFADAQENRIVVSADGKGNFQTVQAALNSVPVGNSVPLTIFIRNGIYKEKLHLDSSKNFVTLIGEDKFKTIITFDDHTGKTAPDGSVISTSSSYTFRISADNFSAKNITFRNDAGPGAGQAVGLEVKGDKAIFLNCRIIGDQDILFLNSPTSRQFYKNCYIEGTTDFIFGAATAWFEQCHIHSKKESYITAASTPQSNRFGFVFYDCMLTADSGLHKVFLGRPWRPYASVAFLHCFLGSHILSAGWSAWNKLDSFALSRYSEYQNYGPGSATSQRVSWSRQTTDEEASFITIQKVLNWDPTDTLLRLEKMK